jgi:RNA polymerase sigma-70 factor (ECF subfamily)
VDAVLTEPALSDVFAADRRFLWGLCYRLTGCAADADDLVQEAFVRAMERPPVRTHEPWRPWLVKVALNLGRDLLRRRRRRAYVGPWLPSPIDTGDEVSPPSYEPTVNGGETTEGRYDLLESVSFAFLLALEALTPLQRAVLLLRDVFDYAVAECADVLGVSEANVKTTHHRARRAMAAYDRERCVPRRELQDRTRAALERFMTALASDDVPAVEAMLAESVRAYSDGGGEFFAARVPVVGRAKVARFFCNIARRRGEIAGATFRMMNGLPALVTEFAHEATGEARWLVTRLDIDADGRIMALHSVLASRKLTGVPACHIRVSSSS